MQECRPTGQGSLRLCNNFHVRLSLKKRVIMGLSDVQGWGAFCQQRVEKDGFLSEYCGELVDHEEADRRGRAYDRDDNSYLFDLK
jgi:[histone H3]-lysine27 N-trimethyltransferase EZH2